MAFDNPNTMVTVYIDEPVTAKFLERLMEQNMAEILTESMEKDDQVHFCLAEATAKATKATRFRTDHRSWSRSQPSPFLHASEAIFEESKYSLYYSLEISVSDLEALYFYSPKMTSTLAARVFLAFDDFSRAGKHVLRFAKFDGAQALSLPQATVETLLPAKLCSFVRIYQSPDNQAAAIFVNSAELPATQRWELADALVSALSAANVQQLTILAALHLPYAKDGDLNVFYSCLNGDAAVGEEEVDTAKLSMADQAWEVKDPWMAALLHMIKVEQWTRTHLLLAKGYKPGRDLSGTYEAVDALARALQLFTKEKVTVDNQEVQRELPRLLAKEKVATTAGEDHLTLLYH